MVQKNGKCKKFWSKRRMKNQRSHTFLKFKIEVHRNGMTEVEIKNHHDSIDYIFQRSSQANHWWNFDVWSRLFFFGAIQKFAGKIQHSSLLVVSVSELQSWKPLDFSEISSCEAMTRFTGHNEIILVLHKSLEKFSLSCCLHLLWTKIFFNIFKFLETSKVRTRF